MTTPTTNGAPAQKIEPLMASDPKILDSVIGPDEIHLYTATEQHANWIECIHTRKPPTAPVELGHRACSTCLLHHIAMKLPRHLHWDPNPGTLPKRRRSEQYALPPPTLPLHRSLINYLNTFDGIYY